MISRRGFFGVLAGVVAVAHVEPQAARRVLPSTTQDTMLFRQAQAQKALCQSSAQRVVDSGLRFKGAPIVFDEDVPPDRMMLLGSTKGPMLVTLT